MDRAKALYRRALQIAGVGLLPMLLSLGACGGGEEQAAADRQQIQATLETYLPKLAEAYASGSAEGLRGLAAEKEVAMVEKLINSEAAEGREIRASFGGLTIEDVTIWGYANAYVTTVELWTVGTYTTGGQRLAAGERRDRVQYQMQREGDQWLILYRQRQDDSAS